MRSLWLGVRRTLSLPSLAKILIVPSLILQVGCGGSGGNAPVNAVNSTVPVETTIVVNSLMDAAEPPTGTTTLRSAIAAAAPGQRIVFDTQLNKSTIVLSIVADEHTRLRGEVMGMRDEPSGPVSYLVGYLDRDYGRSALVARKDVIIDATNLPDGITLAWGGGAQSNARVLAVAGNLTLLNVAITGGRSVTQKLTPANEPYPQPWTLARGGAVAVWGVATLKNCRLYDNRVEGDFDSSRDRGAFGGAVYADVVDIQNCVISGNAVLGGGAAGGGVYAVGGAGSSRTVSSVDRSAVTGNRISGLFAYGGGVYSDGGGIGNRKTLRVTNSTIARNLVEPAPSLPPFLLALGYWRGGGLYMSNGYLDIFSCTIVENEVQGVARTDSLGRRNLAGGIAATVGNAHATEHMLIGQSLIAGNVVQELGSGGSRYAHDVFTGSLLYFRSAGYNRFGMLDFSQMLVPIGEPGWASLSRKHFPQPGDADGANLADVLNLTTGVVKDISILSAGVAAGQAAVLHYEPSASALDQVPATAYNITELMAEYTVATGGTDNFLAILLARLETQYSLGGFAGDFTTAFETFLHNADADTATAGSQPYTNPLGQPILTLANTRFNGPAETWPRELYNYPYIEFWHRLDAELATQNVPGMGAALLNDAAWRTLFTSGPLTENTAIQMSAKSVSKLTVKRPDVDQRGVARPLSGLADIGAIEKPVN